MGEIMPIFLDLMGSSLKREIKKVESEEGRGTEGKICGKGR